MQTLREIKDILATIAHDPKRSLGQNFLIDHNLIKKLVDASGVRPGDQILEVGPGTGTLTEELLHRGANVIACELDDALAAHLRTHIPARLARETSITLPIEQRFRLIHADCLADKHTINPDIISALGSERFSLVANLPYGCATPLLMNLLVHLPQCTLMGITVQRELADRLLATPGSKDFGPLGVLAQSLCEVSRIALAPPECFWPRPEVISALVLLRRLKMPLIENAQELSEFCRVIFAQRRKQIRSALPELSPEDWMAMAKLPAHAAIVPTKRAEELSIAEIVALCRFVREKVADQSA